MNGLHKALTAWGLRLLFGGTLLLFTEIIWWSDNPLAHTPAEWLTRLGLYTALAAVLLDFSVRLAVREAFGVLLLMGIYGLLAGVLITGDAFANLPFSLVQRPLGLHTLGGGVLALLWFMSALDGVGLRRGWAVFWGLIGVVWGAWVRWFPLLPSNEYPLPELTTALLAAGAAVIALGGLAWLLRFGRAESAALLRLRWWEGAPVVIALGAAFYTMTLRQITTLAESAVFGALLGYLIGVLIFQRTQTLGGDRLLVERALLLRPRLGAYAVYGLLLVLPAAVGYALPAESPDAPPLLVLTLGYTAFGVAWLPGVSLGLGMRAYRQIFHKDG